LISNQKLNKIIVNKQTAMRYMNGNNKEDSSKNNNNNNNKGKKNKKKNKNNVTCTIIFNFLHIIGDFRL